MNTYEAIKNMDFQEMMKFIGSIETDTISNVVCGQNCPFRDLCTQSSELVCADFGLDFITAVFLKLDYEKTKVEAE